MFETTHHIVQLQRLLDESYSRAGRHLTSIHAEQVRLTAEELVARLQGMHVFVVATTTSHGRPMTGPVDCFLYRGQFRFGTAPGAYRARHLARSPAVSATHVQGEGLVVTVHGNAESIDLRDRDRDFADFLRSHYGSDHYQRYLSAGPYFGIVPERLFAADMIRGS
jgi:hypothetical protein